MSNLAAGLKAEAHRLGLDAVGIASAAPFDRERDYLAARHAAGQGPHPFEHPILAERVEPDRLLAGARSIIAVAVSYQMADKPEAPADGVPRGTLSRYCRGLDYHTVLGDRLAALAGWLEAQVPGSRSLVHVDMGPPLDRAVAERAGLGRFGKSTLLITPGLGTWTFLGEILTTAELVPDSPAAFSPCGSCTRCIEACPTGCIGEWAIDADRCLGFLNQMDGAMPLAYREAMGTRLFGCDTCQDVCPYNRVAARDRHAEFAALPALAGGIDLVELARLTPAAFEQRYAPTAAAWRGLEPLQRNALVALGNSGEPAAAPALREALDRPEPLLRAHAAWGLGRLARLAPATAAAARAALAERLTREDDASVRHEILGALAGPTGPLPVPLPVPESAP